MDAACSEQCPKPLVPSRWISDSDMKTTVATYALLSLQEAQSIYQTLSFLTPGLTHLKSGALTPLIPWFKGHLIEAIYHKTLPSYNEYKTDLNEEKELRADLLEELHDLKDIIEVAKNDGQQESKKQIPAMLTRKTRLESKIEQCEKRIKEVSNWLHLPVQEELQLNNKDEDEDDEIARLTEGYDNEEMKLPPFILPAAEPQQSHRHETAIQMSTLLTFPFLPTR